MASCSFFRYLIRTENLNLPLIAKEATTAAHDHAGAYSSLFLVIAYREPVLLYIPASCSSSMKRKVYPPLCVSTFMYGKQCTCFLHPLFPANRESVLFHCDVQLSVRPPSLAVWTHDTCMKMLSQITYSTGYVQPSTKEIARPTASSSYFA
eukprot:scaffold2744_cov136-Cylindrotheca_fusiformis.AAC.13